MVWNYRLVELDVGGNCEEKQVGICEVYYDEKGMPTSRTKNYTKLWGESPEDVKEDFDLIAKAFDKPILTEEDFNHD